MTPAEHEEKRATHPVVQHTVSEPRKRNTGTRRARGQPHQQHKTQPANRPHPVDQVAQDSSGSPAKRDLVPPSV